MKRTQKLNLASAWIDRIDDRGDKGIELKITGMNTKSTRVEQIIMIDEWTILQLAEKYADILKARSVSIQQRRERLAKLTSL